MNSSLTYLVQTDTTVGFSSSNDEKLCLIKNRPSSKKILQTVDSFSTLKKYTNIPKKFRKLVRNSKKTTFIYHNKQSFRVVAKDCSFYDFISKFSILYSTSANKSLEKFNLNYAIKYSDVIVETKNDFFEDSPSSLVKLFKNKFKKLR